ncbi:MAG TPA: type I DNA topoisomerase, partial [Flavobacteriaceae bacterium]|nr:type I DNA topoisomerase [Flavobacteriaceae bacterium]
AKAKTIEKFLGKDFQVESSFGHIADLPSKEIGIDLEHSFEPKYIVSTDKKAVVKKLKDLADKSETVWLASDEDREGEAIAWHLFNQLKLKKEKTKRIVFHEITKNAIVKAVENPRSIDINLVNAQQARRVLDRIVGYELSPVLWKKIKGGLSAGRVQSVAVRLIVEREREIQAFKTKASYKVVAEFENSDKKKFTASLPKNFETVTEAQDFLKSCFDTQFKVADLQTKPAKKSPAPPFTTSTLQQEASRKLGYSVARTMQVAQRLYEEGYITYMRTDSLNLSNEAVNSIQAEIINNFGAKYSKPRVYKSKAKGAQEAHEAIRPTNISVSVIHENRDLDRLYQLIWKRTIASQMSSAILEKTTVKIINNNNKYEFIANGEVVKFDGFLKVYLESSDFDDEEQEGMLPNLTVNEILLNNYITATERYTKPPYRYTEASLVKQLEELGIGRPSTYAPTISTIQKRTYVEKGSIDGEVREYQQLLLQNNHISKSTLSEKIGSDKGKLVPTDIGYIVNDFLCENFKEILDYQFTANVEEDFDDIADGKKDWISMIKNFYKQFHPQVENVEANAERATGSRLLGTDPDSGKNVYVRLGRYGAMIQIGEATDDEKPRFASLLESQSINDVNLDDALKLFKLPKDLGIYKDLNVILSSGRFGPYLLYNEKFISIPKGEDIHEVSLDRAIELIQEKQQADAPIATYKNLPVQKGVGRFGPFIKWNDLFINVSKKYDFEHLSQSDIESLIDDKLLKEKDKFIHNWENKGISIQKGRWGRFYLHSRKLKIELSKNVKVETMTLDDAEKILQEFKSNKKTAKKPAAKKKK